LWSEKYPPHPLSHLRIVIDYQDTAYVLGSYPRFPTGSSGAGVPISSILNREAGMPPKRVTRDADARLLSSFINFTKTVLIAVVARNVCRQPANCPTDPGVPPRERWLGVVRLPSRPVSAGRRWLIRPRSWRSENVAADLPIFSHWEYCYSKGRGGACNTAPGSNFSQWIEAQWLKSCHPILALFSCFAVSLDKGRRAPSSHAHFRRYSED